ncbi:MULTISPECIES: DUF3311 domain-containing protein [Parafrankia]|uniref:DUF3311 domain-containing protein n=1 Tax=Parafrankia TaxID=2994362 RepID=UPI000A9966A9|nr:MULTISPECIES: DUF3311 domain-containing protein [Parafrankia]CAI7976735.1 conserved hypothetical protein [Frankia sp. Hr75.2]SQD99656.1 conserved hypothetical protein [Parafrankia sp. Ea1.12]
MRSPSTDPSPPAGPPRGRPLPRGLVRAAVAVLLSAQVVALLLVGTYARVEPRVWGFPFFYWYTLVWLVAGAVSLAGATWLLRRTAGRPDAR